MDQILSFVRKQISQVSEIALWLKVLVAKVDNSSLIPETLRVKAENHFLQLVLWPSHVGCVMPTRNSNTQNKMYFKHSKRKLTFQGGGTCNPEI